MSPESKTPKKTPKKTPQRQESVLVEIHPDSPVDVVEGLLVKGAPGEFTPAEAAALCAARQDGRVICRVVPKVGNRVAGREASK